jgi:hypothetical protein
MALDATAREANVWDSIKKFFVDNMTAHPVTFDKSLSAPEISGRTIDRWYSISMGPVEMGDMSDVVLDIFICSRQDNEWYKNAQMKDTMFELLTDPDQTDSTKRIPFYQSHPTNPWTLIGGILITEIIESPRMEAADETKYKILHCRLRTASKV